MVDAACLCLPVNLAFVFKGMNKSRHCSTHQMIPLPVVQGACQEVGWILNKKNSLGFKYSRGKRVLIWTSVNQNLKSQLYCLFQFRLKFNNDKNICSLISKNLWLTLRTASLGALSVLCDAMPNSFRLVISIYSRHCLSMCWRSCRPSAFDNVLQYFSSSLWRGHRFVIAAVNVLSVLA